jgi:hypothetical protein
MMRERRWVAPSRNDLCHFGRLLSMAGELRQMLPRASEGWTSITEGTANFLANRRMNKRQQMRWSRRGADAVLQVRCAIYNGTLGTGFGHLFSPESEPSQKLAMAA